MDEKKSTSIMDEKKSTSIMDEKKSTSTMDEKIDFKTNFDILAIIIPLVIDEKKLIKIESLIVGVLILKKLLIIKKIGFEVNFNILAVIILIVIDEKKSTSITDSIGRILIKSFQYYSMVFLGVSFFFLVCLPVVVSVGVSICEKMFF
jgi:hypothetical protein